MDTIVYHTPETGSVGFTDVLSILLDKFSQETDPVRRDAFYRAMDVFANIQNPDEVEALERKAQISRNTAARILLAEDDSEKLAVASLYAWVGEILDRAAHAYEWGDIEYLKEV